MIRRLFSTVFVLIAVAPVALLACGGYLIAGRLRDEPALWVLAALMAAGLLGIVTAGLAEIWRVRR